MKNDVMFSSSFTALILSSASFYEVSEFSPNVALPFSFPFSAFVLKINEYVLSNFFFMIIHLNYKI